MRLGPFAAFVVVVCVATVAGCGLSASGDLQGKWIGRPDTAGDRSQREAAKYRELAAADGNAATAPVDASEDGAEQPRRPPVVTDWEQYDVEVALEFVDNDNVRLAMTGEATGAPIEGQWKIVESSPAGMVIEIVTDAAGIDSAAVQRRFEIELDQRDKGLVGFTLNEVGADRRLGALYFRRAE